jgi:hypothetical protein
MQKMIAVDEETYDEIVRLAQLNHRTIGGQVAWMVERVSEPPHPPDATPVPVVYVERGE